MAYIDSRYAKTGTNVEILIREKRVPAIIKQKKNLLQV